VILIAHLAFDTLNLVGRWLPPDSYR
jgi:hypothetical protein